MLCMKLHKNNQKRSLRYPKGSKTGQKMLTSKFVFENYKTTYLQHTTFKDKKGIQQTHTHSKLLIYNQNSILMDS